MHSHQRYQTLLFCLGVLGSFLFSLSLQNCANRISPSGGPRDTLAPYVTQSIPPDQSLNYRGSVVVITFNEWIKDNQLRKQLLITPPTEEVDFKVVRNRFELEFEEALQENTTYSLNFRDGLVDITEGNVALLDTLTRKNLKIAFSTGSIIDSMFIKGQLKSRLVNEPIGGAIIALYKTEDTLSYEEDKPYYYTISDEEGRFALENIQADTYELFAFQDRNRDLVYQEPEAIDFVDSTVTLIGDQGFINNLELFLTSEDHQGPKLLRQSPVNKYYELGFDEGLADIEVIIDTNLNDSLVYDIVNDGNTLRFYNPLDIYDSIPLHFTAYDSIGNTRADTIKIAFLDLGDKKRRSVSVPFQVEIQSLRDRGIEKQLEIDFKFSKPVKWFDPNSLYMLPDQDSTLLAPLLPEDSTQYYRWNKYRTRLEIRRPIQLKENVRIIADSLTFISIEQDTAAKASRRFSLKDPNSYGTIYGEVQTDEPHYILELIDSRTRVIGRVVDQAKFDFTYLPAGEYRMRVIIDRNGNGKWDASDVSIREKAEKILFPVLPNAGKIREKWDIVATIRF